MTTDDTKRYDIAFAGECLEGHDPTAVRETVGALFKADQATLERLFSGTRQRIKRNCDKATALRYQKSLAAAGAKAIVTLAVTAAPPAANETSKPQPGASELQILPGGSDILRPDERTQHTEAALDLSHMTLAQAGDRLSNETIDTRTEVNAPDFDVAEPGAQIGPELKHNSGPTPDTSGLDLAPAGEDLGLHRAQSSAPAPVNTEHLVLADAGSDLLKEDERIVSDAQTPDTSHLELDASENNPKT